MKEWYYNLKKSKLSPPNYVFGIVWPILYLLLGAAWVLSNSKTFYYLVLLILDKL